MSSLSRELVFLILQFLDEEKFKETVHELEQESGFFFNMKYFEDAIHNGEWDDVEKYLSGFTKVDDNRYSTRIFFEIRKHRYIEALDNCRHDRTKAAEVLVKDLKVFSASKDDLFKEITQLLTLENFRENEQLSKYGDTKSARSIMLTELKKLIEANPLFREKLQFPSLKNSRLRTLINQSLSWQHLLCNNPRPNPDIETLFVDHSCGQPNGSRPPSPASNPLLGSIPKSAAMLKRPRTPSNNSVVDDQTPDSDHVLKRPRPLGISDENGDSRCLIDVKPRITDESIEKSNICKLTEINDPSQCQALRLPRNLLSPRVWFCSVIGLLAVTCVGLRIRMGAIE